MEAKYISEGQKKEFAVLGRLFQQLVRNLLALHESGEPSAGNLDWTTHFYSVGYLYHRIHSIISENPLWNDSDSVGVQLSILRDISKCAIEVFLRYFDCEFDPSIHFVTAPRSTLQSSYKSDSQRLCRRNLSLECLVSPVYYQSCLFYPVDGGADDGEYNIKYRCIQLDPDNHSLTTASILLLSITLESVKYLRSSPTSASDLLLEESTIDILIDSLELAFFESHYFAFSSSSTADNVLDLVNSWLRDADALVAPYCNAGVFDSFVSRLVELRDRFSGDLKQPYAQLTKRKRVEVLKLRDSFEQRLSEYFLALMEAIDLPKDCGSYDMMLDVISDYVNRDLIAVPDSSSSEDETESAGEKTEEGMEERGIECNDTQVVHLEDEQPEEQESIELVRTIASPPLVPMPQEAAAVESTRKSPTESNTPTSIGSNTANDQLERWKIVEIAVHDTRTSREISREFKTSFGTFSTFGEAFMQIMSKSTPFREDVGDVTVYDVDGDGNVVQSVVDTEEAVSKEKSPATNKPADVVERVLRDAGDSKRVRKVVRGDYGGSSQRVSPISERNSTAAPVTRSAASGNLRKRTKVERFDSDSECQDETSGEDENSQPRRKENRTSRPPPKTRIRSSPSPAAPAECTIRRAPANIASRPASPRNANQIEVTTMDYQPAPRPETTAGRPRAVGGRVPFSEAEVNALAEGITRYGKSWTVILNRFQNVFHPRRTSVDLKDKARNEKRRLERQGRDLGVFGNI